MRLISNAFFEYIIDSLYIFILGGNVFNVNDKVKKGDLDFILIKPVNPQFFLSFRYVNAHALISIFVLSILLIVLTYSYHNDVLLLINYLLFLATRILDFQANHCILHVQNPFFPAALRAAE